MSTAEKKRSTAQRALERAVEEETAALRAEVKGYQAQVKALHGVLSRIAGIAFGVVGEAVQASEAPGVPLEKVSLPAELAVEAAPRPAEEPIWHEPPIDLAEEDNMGPGRFV